MLHSRFRKSPPTRWPGWKHRQVRVQAVMFLQTQDVIPAPSRPTWASGQDPSHAQMTPGLMSPSRLSSHSPLQGCPVQGPCPTHTPQPPGASFLVASLRDLTSVQLIPPGLLSCCSPPLSRWWVFLPQKSPSPPAQLSSVQQKYVEGLPSSG